MLPLSRSQIERLGERLITAPRSDADLALLRDLLVAYRSVLDEAVGAIASELGITPTARIKNRGTIIEKLQRQGGSWLKSLHDIAGMRVVVDGSRVEQDQVVARVVALYEASERPHG